MWRATKQVEHAAGIIDHMRVFGRKADERPAPFDVQDAVIGAMGLMGEQLRLRDIKVSTDFPKLRRKASGHLMQLEQVVLNLLASTRDTIDRHSGSPDGTAAAPRASRGLRRVERAARWGRFRHAIRIGPVAARGTQEVSGNITGVSTGAEETGEAANQVLEAAGQLSHQSEDLRAAVDKFLADIRAA